MPLPDASLNLVETFDEAESFMRWLGERRAVLAIDTETGGLDWWKDPLRLVQFGDTHTGWAVPWHLWAGLAVDALRLYTGPVVFHNAKFDLHFLRQNGVRIARDKVHDTQTMAHLVDPGNRIGLKDVSCRLVDPEAASGQSELKKAMSVNKWTWATVPHDLPAFWVYAALDTVLTAHLYEQLRPQVVTTYNELYEVEMAAMHVIAEMEVRGARIDLEYCELKLAELEHYSGAIRQWCEDTYGFGPGSNKQVAAQLQRDGIVLTKTTDSGAWSVDEAVLKEHSDHPLAARVLEVRHSDKLAHTYFENFLANHDDGVLHPSVKMQGTRTGRMAIGNGLHQLPRSRFLRDTFIPRTGNELLTADYDQIEARLCAHFSRDPGLIAAFEEEGDFFANLGKQMYNDPSFTKADPRRPVVKNGTYAKIYCSGVQTFADTIGVPFAEAATFLALYDATFPGVKRLQREIDTVALARYQNEGTAYVTTQLGRREPVEDPKWSYKLVNYLIQGTAADILKTKIVELDAAGACEYLILPVHDEVVFDVPAAEAQDLMHLVTEVMADDSYAVPLTAGAEIIDRWGEKYA